MEQMTRDLGLSVDQQRQMKALMKSFPMNSRGGPNGDSMTAMESSRAKFEAILTPEQRKKMANLAPPMMGGAIPNGGVVR